MQDDTQPALAPHLDPAQFSIAGNMDYFAVAHMMGKVPALGAFLQELDQSGVRMGKHVGSGTAAYVAAWNPDKTGMPRGVVRLEPAKWQSLYAGNPLVLQPAYERQHTLTLHGNPDIINVRILPYAPNMDRKPTREDEVRSLRVLKRLKVSDGICTMASDEDLRNPETKTALDYFFDESRLLLSAISPPSAP